MNECELLSRAAVLLAELQPEEDLFQVVAEAISSLAPGDLVVVNSYDWSKETTTVRAFVAPPEAKAQAEALIGRGIVGLTLQINEEARQGMTGGQLTHLPGGLYQLTFQRLPLEQCRAIEAALGVRACFAQPFARGGDILGTVAILSRSESLGQASSIDALTRLAAVSIHRRRAEQQLRESDRRKDEFLAILSHELRNPLAPIINGLYVLQRSGPLDDRSKRAMAVIGRQVGYLTRLIEDLLDVSRLTRGKIRLQRLPIELNNLVRQTVENQAPIFSDRQIALHLDITGEPLWVDADGARIAQVLGNLLSNTVKFTPPEGKVFIRLAAESDTAVLQVTDDGIGIEREMLDQLFLPYVQAERALTSGQPGLGLGLILVKGLVELHGGKVTVQSEGKGKGACFTVRLPFRTAPGMVGPSPSPIAKSVRPRRVLVIEDNRDSADSLCEALEMLGHEVQVAYTGLDGLRQARETKPEVILCDIGLPGLSGYDIAQAIRADPQLSSVLLIALSGYAFPEDQQRAAEAGFHLHLAKPPAIDVLERMVAGAPRAG